MSLERLRIVGLLLCTLGCGSTNSGTGCPIEREELPRAEGISIEDEWSGLGCSYSFKANIVREGDRAKGQATLDVFGTPTEFLIDAEWDAVNTFLSTLAAHPLSGSDEAEPVRSSWSDDYPKASVKIANTWTVGFEDQQRDWHLHGGGNSCRLTPDNEELTSSRQRDFHGQFKSLLTAMKLTQKITELCAER